MAEKNEDGKEIRAFFGGQIGKELGIKPNLDGNGKVIPVDVSMSPEALKIWDVFYEEMKGRKFEGEKFDFVNRREGGVSELLMECAGSAMLHQTEGEGTVVTGKQMELARLMLMGFLDNPEWATLMSPETINKNLKIAMRNTHDYVVRTSTIDFQEWILSENIRDFKREVFTEKYPQLTERQSESVLKDLKKRHIIRLVPPSRVISVDPDHKELVKSYEVYEVNPKCFEEKEN